MATVQKLALAFGWLILLTLVIGLGALFALGQVRDASSALASRWLPSAGHLAAARAALLEHREFTVRHTTAADAGYMDEYEEKLRGAREAVQQALQAHQALVMPGEHQALRATFDKLLNDYLDTVAKVISLDKSGKQEDGKEISEGAGKSSFDDAIGALDKMAQAAFAAGEAAGTASDQVYQRVFKIALGLLALAVGTGLLLAVLIARGLSRDLGGEPREAAELLQRIASGDLTHTVPVRPGDSLSLMASLAGMQERLIGVVDQVRRGADSVATASHEIASGNIDLSQRTEMQAAALQRTSGSMDQLREQALGSADNARDASGVANAASGIAAQGGEVVGGVVSTMRGISHSSARIAEITGVIDGIAFQTNILALNAAVEAARAGEQGRGFAVVAGEVRSLAQRSATAAREIKQLITASVEQIQQGSSQVDRAGATMQEVVAAIQRVDRIVTEIAQTGSHQAQQVNDIGKAVLEMDQSTQQNAALVEESAAAAESLRAQAQQLVQAVAFFRLGR
ncbi:methyl-accepting chemotaxis protein [Roseateles sp. LKC17W]|uniref:methyl-accepting chemotaxis protein n=1 Tax=Pelomonas margarita TaxID=3299031 RepID=UPI0037480F83